MGECKFDLARKFDDYGEYFDVKLNNEIMIFVTDRDTVGTPELSKLIYSGYISNYEPFISGGREGVAVTCLGYYTKLGQDIYKNGTTTTITESGADVGVIMRNILARYVAETASPRINYSAETIRTTSTTASYTFEMMTYREAIEVAKSLAPVDWWWYVNQDGQFLFKSKPSAATHTFVFGRHFSAVKVSKNMEKMKNALLFWNRIVGSGQIYKLYYDAGAISEYGRRMLKIVDQSRVGATADADLIGDGFVGEHKEPDIKVSVEIIDNNYSDFGYDIESIEPGHTCNFMGFSDALDETFKENMMITKVEYLLDRARLTIEPTLAGIVDRIEQIARQVNEVNTKGAPASYNT